MTRRAPEPGPEVSGWAIPYGDFLTLMLAVFIAMYAVSQVNIQKYHALAESLSRAFHGSTAVVQPAPPTQAPRAVPARDLSPVVARPIALIPVPIPPKDLPIPGHEGAAPVATPATAVATVDLNLAQMSARIAQALQPWVARGAVTIHQEPWWLAITIRTDVLFPEGAADLSAASRSMLGEVAKVLAGFPNPVRVEGYTDDLPIHTTRFPSNWELSASRAASVARLFSAAGVEPARIGIMGWSQYRPVGPNASAAQRARNRRIVVVVLANQLVRRLRSLAHRNAAGAVAAYWDPLPAAATSAPPAVMGVDAPGGTAAAGGGVRSAVAPSRTNQ